MEGKFLGFCRLQIIPRKNIEKVTGIILFVWSENSFHVKALITKTYQSLGCKTQDITTLFFAALAHNVHSKCLPFTSSKHRELLGYSKI